MKFDRVHDIQKAYRKVLDCMSRPGHIEKIIEESGKVDLNVDLMEATQVLMLMLLDAEVSFKVISENEANVTGFISQLTYAKATALEEADFVFVLSDAGETGIEQTFKKSKNGNLIDPQKSATVIIEAPELSNSRQFMLRGPGIEKESFAGFGLGDKWVDEREKKNGEFPLGVDALLVDGHAHVLCLPRTTQITSLVVK